MENQRKINHEILKAKDVTRKFKFYISRKPIPWLLGGGNILPQINLSDDWFEFQELPEGIQFDFINQFESTIIVNDDKYTYFKIERYHNNVLEKTFYFYPSETLKWLKGGFQMLLTMDIYMTYTRHILKNINNEQIHIKRGSIGLNHMKSKDIRTYLNVLSNVEGNVLNGLDSYKGIRPYRLTSIEDEYENNLYPMRAGEGGTFGYFYKGFELMGEYSIPQIESFGGNTVNPNGNFWGSLQLSDFGRNTTLDYVNSWTYKNPGISWQNRLSQNNQKAIEKIIGSYSYIKRIWIEDGDLQDFYKQAMNGYFAVFRNPEGYIDCYPIIGDVKADIILPVSLSEQSGTVANCLPATEQNHKLIQEDKYVFGRVYCGYDTSETFTLKNSWEKIYKDLVEKAGQDNPYNAKSFIGIYKGLIPAGKKKCLCFSANSRAEPMKKEFNFLNGVRAMFDMMRVERMYFRLSYHDFMSFSMCEDTGLSTITPTFDKFTIKGNTNSDNTLITDSYIKLLQPINFGNVEVIPARHCFLADNTLKFQINWTGTFLDSFQLFLNSGLYNDGSFSLNFGGTLSTETNQYQEQLKVIEQQKNAGVASSLGNIVGGLIPGITWSRNSQIVKDTSFWDSYQGESLYTEDKTTTSNNQFYLSGITGGISNLINNSISIGNTIRQSNILKRNVGPGYLTSTSDDMMGAIAFNNLVTKNITNPFNGGWFSIGFIKEFDEVTINKYKFYYENSGFAINSLVSGDYLTNLWKLVDNNNIVYFELDGHWALTKLENLSTLSDMTTKQAVVEQISNGIRIQKYN